MIPKSKGTARQHHAPATVAVQLCTSGTAQLHELVNEIPGLRDKSRFQLATTLCHGLLQTMYILGGLGGGVQKTAMVYYGRRVLNFADGGCASVDYVLPPPPDKKKWRELEKENYPPGWPRLHPRTRYFSPEEIAALPDPQSTKPMLVILHGMSGGSHEPFVRMMAEAATEQGFDAVVLNTRGCARTKLTKADVFTAFHTDDLRDLVKVLQKEYPKKPLYCMGFSFGGGVLTNYLSEVGDKSPFVAAATLCTIWDPLDSSNYVTNDGAGKYIGLGAGVAGFLRSFIKWNRDELAKDPFFTPEKLNAKPKSILEFDSIYTAPFYGYQTATQYYKLGAPVNALPKVKTPYLAINSEDDPIVGPRTPPTAEMRCNPFLVYVRTDLGGHAAYIQSDGKSWAINRIVDFFKLFEEKVDTSKKVVSDYDPPSAAFDHKRSFASKL